MAENLKRMADRREKKGEDANGMRMLYHGHKYLAHIMLANGTDYEIDRTEKDYL